MIFGTYANLYAMDEAASINSEDSIGKIKHIFVRNLIFCIIFNIYLTFSEKWNCACALGWGKNEVRWKINYK